MTGGIVVLVSCPTRAIARRLASRLVEGRLAACVNILSGVDSTFRWQGKTERCREVLLLIKTTRKRLPQLTRSIVKLHPYDVPEVIALPLVAGHRPYLQWIHQSVTGEP